MMDSKESQEHFRQHGISMKEKEFQKIGLKEMLEFARKSRGVGDTIAKITNKVGIKTCGGCKKRQKWLNEKFPYKQSLDSGDNNE